MNFEIQCDSGQAAVTTAGTAKFRLPSGFRYDALLLTLVSVTSSLIFANNYTTPLLLKSGQSIQRTITPAQLDALNGLNNRPGATIGTPGTTEYTATNTANPGPAQLMMYFHEPWNAYDPYHRFALDLIDGDNFLLEVPYQSVATAPTVRVFAIGEYLADVLARGEKLNRVDLGNGRSKPTLVKYLAGEQTPAGTTMTITKWKDTIGSLDTVQATRFYESAQTIDQLDFRVGPGNGTSWHNLTRQQNAKLLRDNMMNPLAVAATGGSLYAYDLVPQLAGSPSEGWRFNPNDKVEIGLTFSASSSTAVSWITQAFGPAI